MRSRQTCRQLWSSFPDEKLLDLRVCDLGVSLEDSPVGKAVEQLYVELQLAGLKFRPHAWLSSEWFTPDRVPGIAIPFYLAHPRLFDLERSQMLEVEGGTVDWCMRILRHEAGHAFDNAYLLHRRKRYHDLFGDYGDPYPSSYRPRPYSRNFVVHLDMWYAQAHPAEDFAETFAVWLKPNSRWQMEYEGWPAIEKLLYVDELMAHVANDPPLARSRRRAHPLRSLKMTLREHYATKRAYYRQEQPRFYDRDLRRLFSTDAKYARRMTAATYLESIRPEVRMMVSRWTGESQYTIDRTIADMIKRVSSLKMRLAKPPQQAKTDVMIMLSVQTMNYLNDGRHRVVL